MATRIAQAGVPLVVWSRDRSKCDAVKKHGALIAKSPADCVQNAHVIVLMLSDADAVRDVLRGDEGVLAGLERGSAARKSRAVVIDMATTGRTLARETAALVERHRAQYLDAPVSGSVGPAARGELLALVGGDPRALTKAQPVLDVMCRKVIHAGPIGAGQALKTVLNGVGAHHFVARSRACSRWVSAPGSIARLSSTPLRAARSRRRATSERRRRCSRATTRRNSHSRSR
jgi:3-hydroxyisobutyrate dehydrogenase-like beta-hydroxyacid dehydrogenase